MFEASVRDLDVIERGEQRRTMLAPSSAGDLRISEPHRDPPFGLNDLRPGRLRIQALPRNLIVDFSQRGVASALLFVRQV
jgi:hypothetical protein